MPQSAKASRPERLCGGPHLGEFRWENWMGTGPRAPRSRARRGRQVPGPPWLGDPTKLTTLAPPGARALRLWKGPHGPDPWPRAVR
jgi:hypothetical protein